MAARENQGLQIALIIFVMLTIVLTVTTYLFFKSSSEAQDKIKSLTSDNDAKAKAAQQANAESEQFKAMIGAATTDKVEGVQEATKKDLERYGKGLPASEQNYRALTKGLATELANANTRIAEVTAKEKELTEKVKSDEAAHAAAIGEYTTKLTAVSKDLADERTKFGKALGDIEATKKDLSKKFTDTQKRYDDLNSKTGEQIAGLEGENTKVKKLLQDINREKQRSEKANEVADGKISWVNQRSRSVFLNLGAADGLRQLTTFSVYGVDDTNPLDAERKGIIQVISLLGPHNAEARIVEDDLSNPLMPGDNVFSPTWEPGRPEHFALAGWMDLNQDGVSDRQEIRDLIAHNGGVIDEELDENGKRTGQMSIKTKYLVRGDVPKVVEGTKLSGWSEINDEAQTLGVKTINVNDFLKQMGHKVQDRTVNLGSGANPNNFAPRFPNGVQPIRPSTPEEFRKSSGKGNKPTSTSKSAAASK
jgi:hypothetical protein